MRRAVWAAIALCLILATIALLGCESGSQTYVQSPSGTDTYWRAAWIAVSGPPQALPSGMALEVARLERSEGGAVAGLPENRAMAAGAHFGPSGLMAAQPLDVTVTLPHQVFAGTVMTVYAKDGGHWRALQSGAVASASGTSVSYRVSRLGDHAVMLDGNWRRRAYGGEIVVESALEVPDTDLDEAVVLASGDKDEEPLLEAVMSATGYDRSQAVGLLSSYDDTGEREVEVLRLAEPVEVVRYSAPDGQVGRWFAPTTGSAPLTPTQARRSFALPSSNTAELVALFSLRSGTEMVRGICASMTGNPAFGPYATGGGEQYFVPKATLYPPARWNPDVTVPVSMLRFPEG